MKFKNEDGTINAMPICAIFTTLAITLYILLFGVEIKQKADEIASELNTTTTSRERATISTCDGCNMNFIDNSIDIVINGQLDIGEILKLHKITMNNVTFESEDPNLFTVNAYKSTFVIKTGNNTGTAKIKAKYENVNVETTINVVNPSAGIVKFKYDYYFVAKGKEITPELDIYPYSLNINNIKYSRGNETIDVSEEEGKVRGNEIGTGIVKLQLGNVKDDAKVYVVKNYIKVKVNENGSFTEARSIKPAGDEFDIVVNFEDKDKENFDNLNLTLTFDNNQLGASVKYVNPDRAQNSYIYHVTLQNGATGASTLRVTLSDGSFTLFDIYK